jgi:hypothetical protein
VHRARQRYFEENDFGEDGGYAARFVKLKIGPLRIPLLNTAGRVRAVARHDLHHIATGYDTTLLGEAEIGAWEVGAGCGSFLAAWLLNLSALSAGLFLAPGRIFRAFVRGRRSASLYREVDEIDEALLAGSVAELQGRLRLADPSSPARLGDGLAFAAWATAALLLGGVWLALFLLPLLAIGRAIAAGLVR